MQNEQDKTELWFKHVVQFALGATVCFKLDRDRKAIVTGYYFGISGAVIYRISGPICGMCEMVAEEIELLEDAAPS
jgi:hypothetical protein